MSRRLVVRPDAESDLLQALNWYDNQRTGLGDEFLSAVDVRFDEIVESPESFAIEYRGVRLAGLRRFPYVVYFRTLGEAVEVLAILHASRDPRTWRLRS